MTKKHLFFLFVFLLWMLSISAQQQSFTFALITDTHVGNPNNDEDLYRTVSDINTLSDVAFVIVSGDITEFGSEHELKTAKCLLDDLNVPFYVIPGNHDCNWSESGTNDFLRIFGSEYFGFEYGGYHFVGVGSGPNMRMGPGQIPREHLTWMASYLSEIKSNEPIIYVNHYPMDSGLNNWFEVMDMLKPHHVQLMLCGHGHNNKALNFEGVPAAMCRSNLRAKSSVGGYNLIEVKSDSILFRERTPGDKTRSPWLSYPVTTSTTWQANPPRPSNEMNYNHAYVTEAWSIQEDSDMGGGMALSGDTLVYTTTTGYIKAINVRNKRQIWSYRTDGKIYATPTIYNQQLWCASSDGFLYGIDLNSGRLIHRLNHQKPVVASAVCSDNRVYLAGADGICRAWDTTSGELIWQFDGVKNFVVTRLQVLDDVLYFGSWGNELYALDTQTGNPKWIWKSGHTNRMLSPAQTIPVISHGKVVFASPDRYLTAVDVHTGETLWRHKDDKQRPRESVGVSKDGKTVYVKTMDGTVVAVDVTQSEYTQKWISSGENMGYEISPIPAVEHNGIVYAPTDKGLIFAFKASDGSFLWKYRVSNALINMILPTKQALYVSAMDGKLVKLNLISGQ